MTSGNPQSRSSPRSSYRLLPGGVWALGFVSMFMDISSELVHSLLPVFMVTILSASMVTIGVVEGIAEGAAAMTKVFSGVMSDSLRKRKSLTALGYGLSALTKPVFPLASTIGWVFGARVVDRIGKGIRGAPRDALIADILPARLRGAAYGLRQALDSAGAFLGPLLAVVLMMLLADDITSVLWIAVVPAFLSVVLVLTAVHEPASGPQAPEPGSRLMFASVSQLPRRFWHVVLLGAVFTLARFSEAFLILRARDVGLAIGYVPAVMIVMNVFYAGFAYPAGAAGDRYPARKVLVFGLVLLFAADVVLALASSPAVAFLGSALWGLHMACTQGLFPKLVADTAPPGMRGTAFGVFSLITGAAVVLASILAGSLWSNMGAPATFVAGASFALVAAIGVLLYRDRKE